MEAEESKVRRSLYIKYSTFLVLGAIRFPLSLEKDLFW